MPIRPSSYTLTGIQTGQLVPADWRANPFALSLAVYVTGTITYTVEYTIDDPNVVAPANMTFFPVTGMSGASANAEAALGPGPVTAFRLRTTAGTGTAQLSWLQAGSPNC